jgi:hypothetical protein
MASREDARDCALPRPSFSLAPQTTDARGCFLRQNQYKLTVCPYDVVFFREDFSSQGSTARIDFERLYDWYEFQVAARAVPPRIGAYLPFEGTAMYKTLAVLNLGMSSLYVKLPLFIQLLRGKPYISDVCIPSSYFVMMLREDWSFPATGVKPEPTWVPHVALSATSEHGASAVLFGEAPARVSTTGEDYEQMGYARYFEETNAAMPLRRIPYPVDADVERSERGDIHDILANINALGIRVWSCMPTAMLQNTDQKPEWVTWREANLAAARAVSHSQTTPIVACGHSDPRFESRIPPDVLVASGSGSVNSCGAWHVLD